MIKTAFFEIYFSLKILKLDIFKKNKNVQFQKKCQTINYKKKSFFFIKYFYYDKW